MMISFHSKHCTEVAGLQIQQYSEQKTYATAHPTTKTIFITATFCNEIWLIKCINYNKHKNKPIKTSMITYMRSVHLGNPKTKQPRHFVDKCIKHFLSSINST